MNTKTTPPPTSQPCSCCGGTGSMEVQMKINDVENDTTDVACDSCNGTGEQPPPASQSAPDYSDPLEAELFKVASKYLARSQVACFMEKIRPLIDVSVPFKEALLDRPARVAGRDFHEGQPVQQVVGRAHAHYDAHHASQSAPSAGSGELLRNFMPCCAEGDDEAIHLHRVSAPFQLRGDLWLALCQWCGAAAPFVARSPNTTDVNEQAITEWNRRLATAGQGVEWREQARDWLLMQAERQDANNIKWPEHALAYQAWRDYPGYARRFADEVMHTDAAPTPEQRG